MKIKILYHSFVAATIISLISGCSEDIAKEFFGKRIPIELSASVTSQEEALTRAADGLNTSAGFTLSSTAAYNKVCVNIDGDEYIYSITGEEGASTGTTLEIDQTPPYFPLGETSVSVSARYPDYASDISRSDGTTYFTIQEDQTTQDAYLRSDLMTATATATRAQLADGTWAVTEAELEFQHMMAKLVMNVSTEDENIMKVKKVVVNSVKPRVPLTGNSYTVGEATTVGDDTYDVVAVDEDEGQSSCESAVIIPAQTFQGAFVTVTVDFKNPYNGNESEDVDLVYYFSGDGKEFEANTVYTMNIVVGIDNILLHDGTKTENKVDISAWIGASSTTINIFPTVIHVSLRMEGRILLNGQVVDDIDEDAELIQKTYTGGMITLSDDELKVQVQNSNGDWVQVARDGNYALTYENNVDVGVAKVTVVGIGNSYSGTLEAKFTINKKTLNTTDFTIAAIPDETYDSYPHRPAVNITRKDNGKTLFLDTDFSLHYGVAGQAVDNVNVSRDASNNVTNKTITVTGINNYEGTIIVNYKIQPIAGSYTFADDAPSTNPIRRYIYTKSGNVVTSTYKNLLTSIVGDGQINGGESTNTSVATVGSDGTVTLKGAGTAKISLYVKGVNYFYSNKEFYVTVKKGPILPIMYVAERNMGDLVSGSATFAENNWTTSCSFYTFGSNTNGYDLNALISNGFTDPSTGIKYHVPSYQEWCGILNAEGYIDFEKAADNSGKSASIKFGSTTGSYTSDWKSTTSGSTYALRFKGTDICCAYRYDRMVTTTANQKFTGNSIGKASLVIRVIYLGNGTSETISSISGSSWSSKWENECDFVVSLPISGQNGSGNESGEFSYNYEENAYYASNTTANCILMYYHQPPSGSTLNYTHITTFTGGGGGYSVRLFRDANTF